MYIGIKSASIAIGVNRDMWIQMRVKEVPVESLQKHINGELTTMAQAILREIPLEPVRIKAPRVNNDEVDIFH